MAKKSYKQMVNEIEKDGPVIVRLSIAHFFMTNGFTDEKEIQELTEKVYYEWLSCDTTYFEDIAENYL